MHDDQDVSARAVARSALAVGLAIVLALLLAGLAWHAWLPAGSATGPDGRLDFGIAGPRLSSAPQSEREAYFQEKQALLSQTQWLDRRQGIARIPVEDAMQILARRQAQLGQQKEEPQ